MVQYTLNIRYPKTKTICKNGILSLDHDEAYFFEKDKMIAKLLRAKVDKISTTGIFISGFEEAGFQKNGLPKYEYKEWYCSFLEGEK